MSVHQADWRLADAGEDSKLYHCAATGCRAAFDAPRGTSPPREAHGVGPRRPDAMGWPLPHMEHTPSRPTPAALRAELEKTTDELGNAIYMHRQAWVKAREYADRLVEEYWERNPEDSPRQAAAEMAAVKETDRGYQSKIADVKFWLAERQAHAATVTALAALVALPSERLVFARGGKIPGPRASAD